MPRKRSKRSCVARVSEPPGHGSQSRATPDPPPPRDALSTIRGAELDIIDALIRHAKKGNHQTAKFLFEYAGMRQADALTQSEPSLPELLLQHLGLIEEMAPETEEAGDLGNVRQNLVNREPQL